MSETFGGMMLPPGLMLPLKFSEASGLIAAVLVWAQERGAGGSGECRWACWGHFVPPASGSASPGGGWEPRWLRSPCPAPRAGCTFFRELVADLQLLASSCAAFTASFGLTTGMKKMEVRDEPTAAETSGNPSVTTAGVCCPWLVRSSAVKTSWVWLHLCQRGDAPSKSKSCSGLWWAPLNEHRVCEEANPLLNWTFRGGCRTWRASSEGACTNTTSGWLTLGYLARQRDGCRGFAMQPWRGCWNADGVCWAGLDVPCLACGWSRDPSWAEGGVAAAGRSWSMLWKLCCMIWGCFGKFWSEGRFVIVRGGGPAGRSVQGPPGTPCSSPFFRKGKCKKSKGPCDKNCSIWMRGFGHTKSQTQI